MKKKPLSIWDRMNAEITAAGGPRPCQGPFGGMYCPVDQFVNCGLSCEPWIDILLKYAPRLRRNEFDMVVRCMIERRLIRAVPFLLSLFQNFGKIDATPTTLWVAGLALYTINDRKTYDDIFKICKNARFGTNRRWCVLMLPRMKSPHAWKLLLKLVQDENPTTSVRAAAIEALGIWGNPAAIPILRKLTVQSGMYEAQALNTALRRLERASRHRSARPRQLRPASRKANE